MERHAVSMDDLGYRIDHDGIPGADPVGRTGDLHFIESEQAGDDAIMVLAVPIDERLVRQGSGPGPVQQHVVQHGAGALDHNPASVPEEGPVPKCPAPEMQRSRFLQPDIAAMQVFVPVNVINATDGLRECPGDKTDE